MAIPKYPIKQIQDAFNQAIELDAAEQAAFLSELDRDYPGLSAQVQNLLKQDFSVGNTVGEGDALHALTRELSYLADARLPARVGAYKLIREIGRGGMGRVFLGQRDDGQVTFDVAIKFLDGALIDEVRRHRFQIERDVIAKIDHPGVARLIDAGETDQQVPYYIMEYVDGVPLDVWCQSQKLKPSDILRIYCKLLQALSAVHGFLIVHRDLKPGNILVNKQGELKLIDFGIAKRLYAPASDATKTGAHFMSMNYAAPEQWLAKDVGIAADIYALGVMLYELISGKLPFSFDQNTPSISERRVRQELAQAPSLRIPRLDESLAFYDDLDAVILHCLKKRPDDRYPGVEALAQDLSAILAGNAITIKKDQRTYRLKHWARSNRWWIALATTTAAILLAIIFGLQQKNTQIQQQRDLAQNEAKRAQNLSLFLLNAFASADPSKALGAKITAREILEQGSRDAKSLINDDPAAHADIAQTISAIWLSLGEVERARTLLDSVQSVNLEEKARKRLALQQIHQLRAEGKYLAALAALKAWQAALGQPVSVADDYEASMLTGQIMSDSGDSDLVFEQTERDANRLLASLNSKQKLNIVLLASGLLNTSGEFQRSDRMMAIATAEITAKHLERLPESLPWRSTLIYQKFERKQFAEAFQIAQENLSVNESIYGKNHLSQAVIYDQLGKIARAMKTDGQVYSLKAVQLAKRALPDTHPDVLRYEYNSMSSVSESPNGLLALLPAYQTLLKKCDIAFPDSHPLTHLIARKIARALLIDGKAQLALPYAERLKSAFTDTEPLNERMIESSLVLAEVYLANKDRDAARNWYSRVTTSAPQLIAGLDPIRVATLRQTLSAH